jgi:hypothetical protein
MIASRAGWTRKKPRAHYVSVERSRCAEPNQASIDCITRIESARLKKDVMEHHNDKGISMKHVQNKPHNQFRTALQPRASIKKSKFL